MNAIEFVKKFGVEESAKIANESVEFGKNVFYDLSDELYYGSDFGGRICVNDLKQIVDAFELVETGLPELKQAMFSDSKDLDYVKNWVLTVSEKLLTEKGIKLKQAINLVEQCS